MAVPKDTKDWTWVLERSCPDCGFDASGFELQALPAAVRELGPAWRAVLAKAGVRQRPRDDVWSPLEYACHVRDALRLADERVTLMLTEPDPVFANWDQDETATSDRYAAQDPLEVALEIDAAASRLADRFSSVPSGAWDRRGRRSDGAEFTVGSFGKYLLHDPVHHLWDVR